MSGTTRRPLPPALKALQHILDALPPEEDSEDETETVNIKDFTVRVFYVSYGGNFTPNMTLDQVGAKVFYPKGEIQRESYRTKDGKVRDFGPGDAICIWI